MLIIIANRKSGNAINKTGKLMMITNEKVDDDDDMYYNGQ